MYTFRKSEKKNSCKLVHGAPSCTTFKKYTCNLNTLYTLFYSPSALTLKIKEEKQGQIEPGMKINRPTKNEWNWECGKSSVSSRAAGGWMRARI